MIKLWNQTMPHRCVEDAFEPYLTPYDCDAAKTAIVVCPGGAYCGRADYEGNDVGAWLNTIGITAFVLEYRVAPSKAPAQPSDAQRAMRLARKLCMSVGSSALASWAFPPGAIWQRHCLSTMMKPFTRRRMSLTIYLPALILPSFAIV